MGKNYVPDSRYIAAAGHVWRLGDPFLVDAFFNTLSERIEDERREIQFPLLGKLPRRKVRARDVEKLRSEIVAVKEVCGRLPSGLMLWRFNRPSPRRPWTLGKESLAHCFVDEQGTDLFLAFELAVGYAVEHGQSVEIVGVGAGAARQ